jgi:hypothetical protein
LKENPLAAMALLLLILLVPQSLVFKRVQATTAFDIIIFADPEIRTDIQAKLNQLRNDLTDEGWSRYQYNATSQEMNENATYFRELLQNYSRENSICGTIFVGGFPSGRYQTSTLGVHYMTDFYLMDLDGNWTDTNHDGAFDQHTNGTGDMAPEIWVGRITASHINGNRSQLLNNYLQKNHNYRTNASSTTWPRRALAYADNTVFGLEDMHDPSANLSQGYFDFVENMTTCLEKMYNARIDKT